MKGIATDYFFCANKLYKPNDFVDLTPEQVEGVEHLIQAIAEEEPIELTLEGDEVVTKKRSAKS